MVFYTFFSIGGLRKKKKLTASLVKHFTENHEETICIGLQFHNSNLSYEECFEPHVH